MFGDEYEDDVNVTYTQPLVIHSGWDIGAIKDIDLDWRTLEADEQVLIDLKNESRRISKENRLPINLPFDKAVGMEVGDDRVDKSNSPTVLSLAHACQSMIYCMKTSKEDTFISMELYNLCEVTSFIPRAKEENFNYCRKTGDFSTLGFVDVAPQRIVLDVSKGDGSHSSTVVGKAAMLGSRMYCARGPLLEEMHMASFLQDGYLNTGRSPDPKYLPLHMGGGNAPGLFEEASNIYLYVQSYKGGGYDRLYGSATEELMSCIRSMDTGVAKCPVLCTRLREKQDYLHGTYKEHVMIAPKEMKSQLKEQFPPPVYKAHGGTNEFAAAELRLIRAKVLITRTQAEIEVEKTSRLSNVLFGTSSVLGNARREKNRSKQLAKEYDHAIRANSALQNLLKRKAKGNEVKELRKLGFHDIPEGDRLFRKNHAKWLEEGGRGLVYTLRDLSWSEDMYLRDEVSTEESMKVSGIPLDQTLFHKRMIRMTVTRVGLYQINEDQHEWALRLGEEIRELRDSTGGSIHLRDISRLYENNREWVNDDTLLIAKSLKMTKEGNFSNVIILVSDDRKLANQMCQTANITVVLVNPRDVFIATLMKTSEEFRTLKAIDVWTKLPPSVTHLRQGTVPSGLLVDYGAVMAGLASMEESGKIYTYNIRKLLRVKQDSSGRTALYQVDKTTSNMRISNYKIFRPDILNRNKVLKYPKYKRILPMKPSENGEGSSEADWRSSTNSQRSSSDLTS